MTTIVADPSPSAPVPAESTPSRARVRPKAQVTLPPADTTPAQAADYFRRQLAFETDPADVHHDMQAEIADFLVLDVRSAEAFERCRVPGARHFPVGRIRESTTRDLDPSTLLVTYCWSAGCNGATKAAARLSELGFRVRVMLGGIEAWRKEGCPVLGSETDRPLFPEV